MRPLRIMTTALFSLLTSSCGNYLERKSTNDGATNPAASEVSDFAVVQSKIFNPRCVSCHQQYSSYAGVLRELEAIRSAVDSDRMPKSGGPLSETQKQLLQKWIATGAPEVAGGPPPPPTTLEPTWASISENIISPRCLACHNPNGQAKFLGLSTRQAIFSARDRLFSGDQKLIDFEHPERSYLITILQDDIEPMPPVWSNIRRLNEHEIGTLTQWIERGLP